MENWKERLVKEHRELQLKISKLNAFINSDVFYELSGSDQLLLELQRDTMLSYEKVLFLRIQNIMKGEH